MICPRCNTNLLISNINGIEIDNCPTCRGVWLDRGELEKIIERSNNNWNTQMRHNEHSGHDEHRYEKQHDSHHDSYPSYNGQPRHKKSFLSELFDF
ncbi:MAG: zf-TFIIB domain-containing protein [Bacteroidota bacterium]